MASPIDMPMKAQMNTLEGGLTGTIRAVVDAQPFNSRWTQEWIQQNNQLKPHDTSEISDLR
jgi:hypothetical protein